MNRKRLWQELRRKQTKAGRHARLGATMQRLLDAAERGRVDAVVESDLLMAAKDLAALTEGLMADVEELKGQVAAMQRRPVVVAVDPAGPGGSVSKAEVHLGEMGPDVDLREVPVEIGPDYLVRTDNALNALARQVGDRSHSGRLRLALSDERRQRCDELTRMTDLMQKERHRAARCIQTIRAFIDHATITPRKTFKALLEELEALDG